MQKYAHSDIVWAAQGCWIYLCADTPFIKELQAKASASAASVTSSLTDYIVFMDENFNIVPLMVPGTVTKTYNDSGTAHTYQISELTVNPVIRYWTSLIFYNQPYFIETDNQGNVKPIMYDLKGGTYLSEYLGSIAGAKKVSGYIPNYLFNAGQGVTIAGAYQDIYNQFQMHKAALLYKLNELDMTVGGALFKTSDYVLNVQGQNIPTYTSKDLNCFGTSNTPDLFVALDNNGNPIGLPSQTVLYMQSLVTDITYQLDNTTNTWAPAISYPNIAGNPPTIPGFKLSPLKLNKNNNPIKKSDNKSYEISLGADLSARFE